jgi:putative aldouronate transport system permease protein
LESGSGLPVSTARGAQKKHVPFKERFFGYDKRLFYLAIPFMIYIFIFAYLPLSGWTYAFFDYKPGIPLLQNRFTGFKFYLKENENDERK